MNVMLPVPFYSMMQKDNEDSPISAEQSTHITGDTFVLCMGFVMVR